MKISLGWLKNYIAIGISPEKFAHKLTMAGLEVEKTFKVKGDTVFELEITPNRPDCLSVYGLAREAGAILNKPCKFPPIKKRFRPKQTCSVEIRDTRGCSRYIGTLVEGVMIKKAQRKDLKHLNMVGVRSINNVADITNFCLMETGQPMHAFDYDKLKGGKIIVRRAKKGEKITTLDGVERKLDPSILVIADKQKPVAIAGIMGGKDTEVTGKTKNVLLESAYFDPILIRRASRKLGLSSDSSYRFERGIDFPMVETGADRAIDLILDEAGGDVTKRTDKTMSKKKKAKPMITISANQINACIGASLTAAKYKNILTKLDFNVKNRSGVFKISPPSFREDIKEPVDIVEEVSRIIGYDNLPLSFPQISASDILSDSNRKARQRVHNLLLAQGLDEIITYTMISRRNLEQSGQSDRHSVAIFNPLTQDQEIMRPSLLPCHLQVLLSNINHGQKNIKFFETGKIYTAKGEKETLGVIMTGLRSDDWRQSKKKDVDYYDIKGVLTQVFNRFSVMGDSVQFKPKQASCFEDGQGAAVVLAGKEIGAVGKINEDVLSQWGIKQEGVYFAEIDLESIYKRNNKQRKYKPISEFPAITRDISLAVKHGLTACSITEAIRKTAKEVQGIILTNIKFVELYQGEKISKDSRGLIFSLTYQARPARTLRDEEVERVHRKVCDRLKSDLGVIQR